MYKIWWIDTIGYNGWYDEDTLKKQMKGIANYMETIGFYVCEDKNFYCMAMLLNREMETFGHIQYIPIGCVKRIKKLKI